MRRTDWLLLAAVTGVLASAALSLGALSDAPAGRRLDGFNVIMSRGDPFGSASARLALMQARRLGANTIAVIPFLWQAKTGSPDLVRGRDMSDAELRAAIREGHELGFAVIVKPQVWVPESWAGAVAMTTDAAWRQWFTNYASVLHRISRIAEEENAEALAVGTELAGTTGRPEWRSLIGDVRNVYSGRLLYVAHNVEDAEAVPFWDSLDDIGVSLYPPLGTDADRDGRRVIMRAVASRLVALSARTGKSVIVAEIGVRSAQGATAKPWESAEERVAPADGALQADVLADWLSILNRPAIRGVLVWRWFTDPGAGGPTDTDFTVQGKPAQRMLQCVWAQRCNLATAGAG